MVPDGPEPRGETIAEGARGPAFWRWVQVLAAGVVLFAVAILVHDPSIGGPIAAVVAFLNSASQPAWGMGSPDGYTPKTTRA